MKIVLGFPTLDRQEACEKCIDQARKVGFEHIIPMVEYAPRPLPAIYRDVLDRVFHSGADVCVLGSDACRFQEGIVEGLERRFEKGLDKIVGLNLTNLPPNPGVNEVAFVAIGSEFARRFPNYQLHCPAYWHFHIDAELGMCAKTLGKFEYGEECKVEIDHPNTGGKRDSTHAASRIYRREDYIVWLNRSKMGLIWGLSLEGTEVAVAR